MWIDLVESAFSIRYYSKSKLDPWFSLYHIVRGVVRLWMGRTSVASFKLTQQGFLEEKEKLGLLHVLVLVVCAS